jgi:hypothetical protein
MTFSPALSMRSVGTLTQFRSATLARELSSSGPPVERLLRVAAKGNLAARLAVLSTDSVEGFESCVKKFSILYQRRPEIVHGSAHRTRESWSSSCERYRVSAAGTGRAIGRAWKAGLHGSMALREVAGEESVGPKRSLQQMRKRIGNDKRPSVCQPPGPSQKSSRPRAIRPCGPSLQ